MQHIQQIPRDNALPNMAPAMKLEYMREVFQKKIFSNRDEQRFQVRACAIDRVKHKAGQNCMLSYRLQIHDRHTQQREEHVFCARIYRPNEAPSRFHKAQASSLVAPAYGPPLMLLPELDMIVWAFPNDRKLHGLPLITNRAFLKDELLPNAIKSHFGPDWKIADLERKVIHYIPEHTCTVRVVVHLNHARHGARKAFTFFGKTYWDDEGAEAYENMLELWLSKARHAGALGMAQPFIYHAETKSLWQFGLTGKTLIEYDMRGADFFTLLPAAAANVASLHQTAIFCSRKVKIDDLRGKLEEMQILLADSLPEQAQCAKSLIDRLLAQSSSFGQPPRATLHGDLHLKNFFVAGGKVALIDMDNLCNGHPLQDVGSFIAGLWYRGILTEIPEERIKSIVDVFTQGYKQRVPWHAMPHELAWHTAAALITERAFRCLTRLKAGRLDILADLLKLADEIIG